MNHRPVRVLTTGKAAAAATVGAALGWLIVWVMGRGTAELAAPGLQILGMLTAFSYSRESYDAAHSPSTSETHAKHADTSRALAWATVVLLAAAAACLNLVASGVGQGWR